MYIFFIFFNMTVCCVLTLNYSKYKNVCSYGNLFEGLEIAVVNEPSVFEPMKFYCIIYN